MPGDPRPTDLRLDERDSGEIGPGQVLVRVAFGGICGSYLHYSHHGGFGTVRIQQPMVLGHEVAGSVAAVVDDVTSVKVGDRVAVNTSRLVGEHYLGRRARWLRRLRQRRRRPSRLPGLMTWMTIFRSAAAFLPSASSADGRRGRQV